MKKTLLLALFVLTGLLGCASSTTTSETTASTATSTSTSAMTETTTTGIDPLAASPCKDDPLSEACYTPSYGQTHAEEDNFEYTISETFETDFLNQMPSNWLLYSHEEYQAGGVTAKIAADGDNQYVTMYSDGLQKPLYPQNAPTPTFIFTTKFNLDTARAGIATIDVMVPSENPNSVSAGVSTGAVNCVSVIIDNEMDLSVKIGGPFYYYSLNGDAGQILPTGLVLDHDEWYTFRFEWDAEENLVQAFLVTKEGDILLHQGTFHISNRFNAMADGEIYVPNVVKVTMPFGQDGFACIDNAIVTERGGE